MQSSKILKSSVQKIISTNNNDNYESKSKPKKIENLQIIIENKDSLVNTNDERSNESYDQNMIEIDNNDDDVDDDDDNYQQQNFDKHLIITKTVSDDEDLNDNNDINQHEKDDDLVQEEEEEIEFHVNLDQVPPSLQNTTLVI